MARAVSTDTPPLSFADAAALTRRVTLMSVSMAALLSGLKAWVYLATGSVAILASAADSALDLVASSGTFIAVRYAAVPPDAEHRFGHGKAEAFASLFQAGLVFASAALVGKEAVQRLIVGGKAAHPGLALGVMVLSIVLTIGLVFAQTRLLARTRSVAVAADRTHYATDVVCNLVILAGVGLATLLQAPLFDAGSGLVVAALLLVGAIRVFREAANQLMDRELSDADRARIVELVRADAEIGTVRDLRTRAAGPITHIQLRADLDPDLTLAGADQKVQAAERRIRAAFPAADVLIHPCPGPRASPSRP